MSLVKATVYRAYVGVLTLDDKGIEGSLLHNRRDTDIGNSEKD